MLRTDTHVQHCASVARTMHVKSFESSRSVLSDGPGLARGQYRLTSQGSTTCSRMPTMRRNGSRLAAAKTRPPVPMQRRPRLSSYIQWPFEPASPKPWAIDTMDNLQMHRRTPPPSRCPCKRLGVAGPNVAWSGITRARQSTLPAQTRTFAPRCQIVWYLVFCNTREQREKGKKKQSTGVSVKVVHDGYRWGYKFCAERVTCNVHVYGRYEGVRWHGPGTRGQSEAEHGNAGARLERKRV
jgi:hypothetical protein